ncbi:Isopentenyldiphosphate isomerase [Mesobacillus persicus]|uniref:Isopentenyldiphosphate isomerase n=1 Tax=Mesobacillus persicus TaxID=930146 RepID=A0A1H8ESX0_9BACI|nr:NUDIX domain-containing protein [Mesobacillus persicus]SEN21977.1 Isopentenyldiphosphate isomerase [Mesobacillus persicus]
MELERLNIFDEQYRHLGTATREEVHRLGHWHETFHCWFVCREKEENHLYFQLRSPEKKDYPDLFDITAAGHLLATENVKDGIREVKEELGIAVDYDELMPLGIAKYSVVSEQLVDNELANVFLYNWKGNLEDFQLRVEEVSGIVRVKLVDFALLISEQKQEVKVEGFTVNHKGERANTSKSVSRESFVPHEKAYYESVLRSIQEKLL